MYKIGSSLDLSVLQNILDDRIQIALSDGARKKILRCRQYLDKKIKSSKDSIYGINTGFGSLYNQKIADRDLEKLQENLVMSHACGMGDEVNPEIVRIMLLLKIQGLAQGHSGVSIELVERLIYFYNNDILPVVYEQGSLGASGDLAPLAHLSLPLIGRGEVLVNGQRLAASEMLKQHKLKPLVFQSKEALALLNGTQFMSAYGVYILLNSRRLTRLADVTGAISLEGFDGRPDPFSPLIHDVRPHNGQRQVAARFRTLLKGSKLISRKKQHVQDPYSFRCIPQVHGASQDALAYAETVFQTEINSVTDNPTLFPEQDEIISGGNFHGQPLALTLDHMAIALSELGSISERRTYLLISGQRGLPPFLVANPGLNSGFMIPQYTAASIASMNKQLCSPSSVDSIVSSNGQEDHVSMGANAAVKCLKVLQNLERILAIEFFTATQALEFRQPVATSPSLSALINKYRKSVKAVREDKVMYEEMNRTVEFIRTVQLP